MQCIIAEKHDETKKMAQDSQIVRAKENIKLSQEECDQSLASATKQPMKAILPGTIVWLF